MNTTRTPSQKGIRASKSDPQTKGEASGAAPPRMRRSVGQLASSYAPMRHFAFENGLGICLSVPSSGQPALGLSGNTPDQIHRRLSEAAKAWFRAGENCLAAAGSDKATLLRHLVVDDSLYDPMNEEFEYRREVFGFVEPKNMAYEVAPTTLVCGTCSLFAPCNSARGMGEFLEQAAERCKDTSQSPSRCRWRQFEPIFVHPSGSWRSVNVAPMDNFPGDNTPGRRSASCEACGHGRFRVDMSKVTLSGWFLKCASCGVRTSWAWTDNDDDYLRAARRAAEDGSDWKLDDARMEKISYGAAIAFIPHSETFVDLPDAEVLGLIESQRIDGLCDFVAAKAGYLSPFPSPEDAAATLENGGEAAKRLAQRIRMSLATASTLESVNPSLAESQRQEAVATVAEAVKAELIRVQAQLPPALKTKVVERTALWSNRYDPFQLAIEHEALASTKLSGRSDGPRASFIHFDRPDQGLRSTEDEGEGAAAANAIVRRTFDLIGVEEAGLIPQFGLCRFTYGYSRTSSVPVHPKRKVPVRLKLFPRTLVGGMSEPVHPIYVLRQKNEAFYFRLKEDRVRAWLEGLVCADRGLLASEPSLRGALLLSAHPMDRFLTEHDRDRDGQPRLYAATYGLIHTMAHHVIRTLARLSGLDEGSLGEYIFPTDLAFVVYRSGMTMDLGDLSSVWRNCWRDLLGELSRYANSLGCNVGSLCSEQGGACPDCVMIPEVVCVAGNRYLSRSLLTGEGRPGFMKVEAHPAPGYLQ